MKRTGKQVSTLKQLIKWLLLLIGLFLLFYYQLPLKIVAFFIVLCCLECLIPKRYRKWVNGFYGVISLFIVVWMALPDHEDGWKPYVFHDELVALEKQRAIPREDNAAAIYNQTIKQFDKEAYKAISCDGFGGEFILDKPWNSEQCPEAAQWIQKNQFLIDGIREAVKYEKCVFPLALDVLSPEFKLPKNGEEVFDCWYHVEPFSSLSQLGQVIKSSALHDIAEGRDSTALEKYLLLHSMGDHLLQQYTFDSKIRGLSFQFWASLNMSRWLVRTEPKEDELMAIETQLLKCQYNWTNEIKQVLEAEELLLKDSVCSSFYQINQEGDIRINFDPEGVWFQFTRMVPSEEPFHETREPTRVERCLRKKFHKLSRTLFWFFLPDSPSDLGKVVEKHLSRYNIILDVNFDKQDLIKLYSLPKSINIKTFVAIMSAITDSNYEAFRDMFLEVNMGNNSTQIILALKRYKNETGHWPESLDVISDQVPKEVMIDPINKGSFAYRLDKDGFIFYSRGRNDIDEYEQLLWQPPADPNEIDFSLPRPDDIVIWPSIDN